MKAFPAWLALLLFLGCAPQACAPEARSQQGARDSGPPLEWAEEAAGVWLRALSRNDPRMAWDGLSWEARQRCGSEQAFRRRDFPLLRERLSAWAWPGSRVTSRRTGPERAVVVLEGAGARLEVPVSFEEEDWKVDFPLGGEGGAGAESPAVPTREETPDK